MKHSTAKEQDSHRGHSPSEQEASTSNGRQERKPGGFVGLRAEGLNHAEFIRFRNSVPATCRELGIELETIGFSEHHTYGLGRDKAAPSVWASCVFQPCEAIKAYKLKGSVELGIPGVKCQLVATMS